MKKLISVLYVISAVMLMTGCPDPDSPVLGNTKEVTAFSFKAAGNTALSTDTEGTIKELEIVVSVPKGTDVTALVATFETTGTEVSVDGTVQVSGMTANDFTNPVIYTVTAEDGTALNYEVEVALPAIEDSGFSSASAPGDSGVLSLPVSFESITMIYAQDQGSITFPVKTGDSDTADIDHEFWIGETEVTNTAFAGVYQWAYNNGKFSNSVSDPNGLDETTAKYGGQQLLDLDSSDCRVGYDGNGDFSVESGYGDHPVTDVTWFGAVMFCNWLTEMRDGNTDNVVYSGMDSDWDDTETVATIANNGYRLPDAEEWEYAARYRGSDTTNVVTDTINGTDFSAMAVKWTRGNSASGAVTNHDDTGDTNPANGVVDGKDANDAVAVYGYYWDGSGYVSIGTSDEAAVKSLGSDGANSLGLYDMSGNVSEWCFSSVEETRGVKGGSWSDYSSILQVGYEAGGSTNSAMKDLGFRLCRTAD